MKTYSVYHLTPHGWYKTDSPRSPLSWVRPEFLSREEALVAGFAPATPNAVGEFASVITSSVKGFRGRSSRVYVSRWVRK